MPLLRRLIVIAFSIYTVLWMAHFYQHRRLIAARPPHVAKYVEQFSEVASEVGKASGVPPAIILAVGGLESAWGASELARESHNFFGIKAKQGDFDRYCLPTREFTGGRAHTVSACFRAYASPQDSFIDYGVFLGADSRYQELFHYDQFDYYRWAHGLQRLGYATDPEYAEKIIRVVQQYGLYLN